MSSRDDPAKGPEEPHQEHQMPTSIRSVQILAGCFMVAFQKAFDVAVLGDDDRPRSERLEILAAEILRDVKNLSAQGASEFDEAQAKRAALSLIEGKIAALRKKVGK